MTRKQFFGFDKISPHLTHTHTHTHKGFVLLCLCCGFVTVTHPIAKPETLPLPFHVVCTTLCLFCVCCKQETCPFTMNNKGQTRPASTTLIANLTLFMQICYNISFITLLKKCFYFSGNILICCHVSGLDIKIDTSVR